MDQEQSKLPNGTLSLVLGISGLVCCCTGVLGVIPSAIGFYLAFKSEKMYKANPDAYDNYKQIKTAKIVALIAMILSVIMIVRWTYIIFGLGGFAEFIEEFKAAYQEGLNQYQ